MPTPKQIAASRANGQKSHGPTTSEGKAKSRYNALKHGIHAQSQIMFETAEDLAELAAELHDQYNPADSTERFLVDTLINNEWRLRRLRTVEADLWQTGVNTYLDKHPEIKGATSGDALATIGPAFERLQRIVNSCERAYHRALKELVALEVARTHALRTPQSEETTTSSESPGSFRTNPEHSQPKPQKPPRKPPQTLRTMPNPLSRPLTTSSGRISRRRDSRSRPISGNNAPSALARLSKLPENRPFFVLF
jgi:hypothetical protein